MKEVGESWFVVPRGIHQTKSVVHIAKKAGCQVHRSQSTGKGAIPDLLGECDDHQAKSGAQWGSHRGATNLLVNRGANGELDHLQGHEDDGLNVSDVDLASHVEGATRSAFDHVSGRVASRGFHRNDFIRVGADHER